MKSFKFPTAQTILLIIAAIVALLTWILPSGKFDELTYNKSDNTFIRTHLEGAEILPATQETLTQLGFKIKLEKFTTGSITKPIGVPNTYQQIKSRPQGLTAFIQAPIKGIIEASDIIFFVLFIGGIIAIINFTGAFNAGIAWLATTFKGREYLLIIFVTLLIAIGGTTFGLAEETIAFYPILIPIFLAANYDAMVALACIYIGSSVGSMCSTVNPFSAIIASDAAGINWTSGLLGRTLMLVACTAICIVYILRYAQKVKKNPEASLIFNQKQEIESQYGNLIHTNIILTTRMRFMLFIFAMCFVVMIFGVSQLHWWFVEMSSVFLVGAILIGLLAKIKEQQFVQLFVKGASELLGVAIIIGIARGISIIMENGQISDTILYYASQVTQGMPKGIFINVLLFIYGGLSFFIPSSSGMAVLTMPIFSSLGDSVGIGREFIVDVYQYGMGLFAFINPTGLILASLAIVNIGFNKWIKFVMPLLLILTVFTMLVITVSVYLF